ncbi:hypothetical protein AHAS_Ahas11G0239300 [Arachis hypogaea]
MKRFGTLPSLNAPRALHVEGAGISCLFSTSLSQRFTTTFQACLESWNDQRTFCDAICSCEKVAARDTYVCNASDKVIVTLEDVLHIFGLPIDGEVVTSWTDSSHDFLVTQSLAIFGSESAVRSSSKSHIKLSWVRHIRD